MNALISPEWQSAALVTIDTQCDTLDGQPLEIAGTSAVLPAMRVLTESFRDSERPIIHIVRIYKPDGSNVDLCRREAVQEGASMLLANSEGSQLAQEFLPEHKVSLDTELLLSGGVQSLSNTEVIIYKPRWGAFYSTPLDDHLRGNHISTLVFAGCNFPNCPRTSIYEASERDYRLVLATDAISGLYEQGRRELENIGVTMMESRSVASCVRAV